jgi:MSHA biogenesis protein MshQ
LSHTFKVQAQAKDGTPTQNYGLFNNELITTLGYVANTLTQTSDVSLLDRISSATSWSGADWPKVLLEDPSTLSITLNDFSLLRKTVPAISLTTIPDGPYTVENSIFGLSSTVIVDDVDFDSLDIPALNSTDPVSSIGKKFPIQPNFRYGRMNLDDVGGNSGQTLTVPLRVEYWDGAKFVTSTEDSGSAYDATQAYCRQTIWNNNPSLDNIAVGLDSGGEQEVSGGRSNQLEATHAPSLDNESERAQVRLWLRQANQSQQLLESDVDCSGTSYTNQPWLQYNWRDQGDEDPSAVVTLGTFRGNDRIIFKGERGLIGN